jgi:hypothetical protein
MDRVTGGRQVPTNEKLYAMVVFQAKAKYQVYPSPGASHWVHRRYVELGGKFEDASDRAYKQKLMKHAAEENKREKLAHGAKEHQGARHKGDDKKTTKKTGKKK